MVICAFKMRTCIFQSRQIGGVATQELTPFMLNASCLCSYLSKFSLLFLVHCCNPCLPSAFSVPSVRIGRISLVDLTPSCLHGNCWVLDTAVIPSSLSGWHRGTSRVSRVVRNSQIHRNQREWRGRNTLRVRLSPAGEWQGMVYVGKLVSLPYALHLSKA